MSSWNNFDNDESQGVHHTGRKINKNKYCKKNKLGHGNYGPHIYENKYCKLCGKIDPSTKRRIGLERENNE